MQDSDVIAIEQLGALAKRGIEENIADQIREYRAEEDYWRRKK